MSNTIKSDKSNIENIAKKINKIEVVARRAEKSADAASKEIISKISLIEVGHTSAPNTSLTLNYTGKENYDLFNDGNSLFVKVGNDVAKVISIITDGKGADYEMFYQYGNKVYSCYLNKNESVAFINKIQTPTEPDPSTPEINVNPEYFCDFSDYMGNKSEINFNPYTGLYNSKAEDRKPKGLTPLLYRSDIGDYAGIYLKDMSFASNALNLLNVFNWGKGVKKTYKVTTKFNKEIDGMSSNKARTITTSKQVTIYDPWNKKSWYYCPCCGKRAKDQNKWKLVNPVATGGADEDNAFGGEIEAEFEYVGNPTKESNKDYHEDNTLNSVFILIYYFFLKLREIMNKNTISLKDQIFKLFKLINGAKEDANKVTSITSKENGWEDNSFEFKSKVDDGTFGLDDLFDWIFALFGFKSEVLEKIIDKFKDMTEGGWKVLLTIFGSGKNGLEALQEFFSQIFDFEIISTKFMEKLAALDTDGDGQVSISEFFNGITGSNIGSNFDNLIANFTEDFNNTVVAIQNAIGKGISGLKELFSITFSGNIFMRIAQFFLERDTSDPNKQNVFKIGNRTITLNTSSSLNLQQAWDNLLGLFGIGDTNNNLSWIGGIGNTWKSIITGATNGWSALFDGFNISGTFNSKKAYEVSINLLKDLYTNDRTPSTKLIGFCLVRKQNGETQYYNYKTNTWQTGLVYERQDKVFDGNELYRIEYDTIDREIRTRTYKTITENGVKKYTQISDSLKSHYKFTLSPTIMQFAKQMLKVAITIAGGDLPNNVKSAIEYTNEADYLKKKLNLIENNTGFGIISRLEIGQGWDGLKNLLFRDNIIINGYRNFKSLLEDLLNVKSYQQWKNEQHFYEPKSIFQWFKEVFETIFGD